MAYSIKLLEAADATGEYKVWNGDSTTAQLVVSGTFDGAAVTLKSLALESGEDISVFEGSSELSVDGTGAQQYLIKLNYGEQIKAEISSAGVSTSLYAILYGLND